MATSVALTLSALWLVCAQASAATNPAELEPVPLRQLYTAPNARYLYTASFAEAETAQRSFGLTIPSPRPLAYVFERSAPDVVPMYRLKEKATGNWLETTSASEIHELVEVKRTFAIEGLSGYVYAAPEFGAEQLDRFDNGAGWRLAFANEAAALKAAGYSLDGPVGYALRNYYQVGAYYFGAYDSATNPLLLEAVKRVYGRYPDPWGGVRDFSGDDPNVPQNTQGWGGDWSDLEPSIGFYDDSKPETLEKQIQQAAEHGLSYFAFYDYWNDQTEAPQYDDAVSAFLKAGNRSAMKFMITPCISQVSGDAEHLDLPESQFASAAADFASYTTQPNYMTTQDGRPMILMCDTRAVGDGSVAAQNRFIGDLRAAVEADTGKNPYISINSDLGPEESRALAGDAYSCIAIGRFVNSGSYREYVEKLNEYFSYFDAIRPTMRCAMSGFDERPRTGLFFEKSQARYFKDDTKGQFPAAMQSTRADMEGEPATVVDNYLTIYAWNEWEEGGHIEPNVRDGDYYLRVLKETFGLIPRPAPLATAAPAAPASPAPPSAAPGKQRRRPAISRLKVRSKAFRVRPKHRKRAWAWVSYRDSAKARATLTVLRRGPDPFGAGRHPRWTAVGSFRHADRVGRNRLAFSGRLKGRPLRPGRYRLKLVASLGGLSSRPRSVPFKIGRFGGR